MNHNISKKDLFISIQLEVYKKARIQLLSDFIYEDPEIFNPAFKYEKSIELLTLSMDKYFIGWIDTHWKIFSDYTSELNLPELSQEELRDYFLSTFKELINKIQSKQKNIQHSSLFLELVKHKIKFLSDLLNVADAQQNKYNALEYSNTKDKNLFDRQIKKIKGK